MNVLSIESSIPQTTALSYKNKICHFLCDWSSDWQMEFNKCKCHVLHMSRKKQAIGTLYYLQDTPLEMSTEQKYLGVDLSNDLDWSHQINSITTRANKTLGLLRRNNVAYKTRVRPQLEHYSPIWDPYEKGHILSLEKVQRRAARFVSGRLP